jgi:cyclophilin family peptidyl-prolyl cis-trans isomerase/protein-disulfide isomerase
LRQILLLALLGVLVSSCVQPAASSTASPRRTAPSLGPTDLPTATHSGPALASTAPAATLAPIPAVSAAEHLRGPVAAQATLIVYSDFDCPLCAHLAGLLAQLQDRHRLDLRLVFRQFPLLTLHAKASLAAQVAELAGEQGAFWSMHDRLFEAYPVWSAYSPVEFEGWALAQAEELGLDVPTFQAGLTEGRKVAQVQRAYEEGLAMGIPGSPFLLLDGEPFLLPYEPNYLEAAVRLSTLRARQFADYPPFEIDPAATYRARLQLDSGEIVLQLYPQYAPLAVNSFIFLASQGWFDGNAIHQVQPGVFLESGDPTATGLGDPGYHFAMEPSSALGFEQPGMVALVPTSPETNGGRFFVNLAPLPELDGARTIFGRVLQGMELLRVLPARDPLVDLLEPPPAVLLRVEIEVQP